MELGLVGSLAPVLSADLQGQSVVIAHVDLLTITGRQRAWAAGSWVWSGLRSWQWAGSENTPSDSQLQVRFADVVISAVQQDVSLRTGSGVSGSWTPSCHGHVDTHLLADVGRRRRVEDGLESGAIGGLLVVEVVLHHHGDGRDLISELTVVLVQERHLSVPL